MTTLNPTQIASLEIQLRHILSDTISRAVRSTLGHRPQIHQTAPQQATLVASDTARLTQMKTTLVDDAVAAAERLRSSPWSDAALTRIPNQDLATMAFNMSEPLRREFPSVDQFLSYWRALRR